MNFKNPDRDYNGDGNTIKNYTLLFQIILICTDTREKISQKNIKKLYRSKEKNKYRYRNWTQTLT